MNPDHMPRPFDPPHSEYGGPVRISVHGGDFTETDLIRALDEAVFSFQSSLDARQVARAVNWLQARYGVTE